MNGKTLSSLPAKKLQSARVNLIFRTKQEPNMNKEGKAAMAQGKSPEVSTGTVPETGEQILARMVEYRKRVTASTKSAGAVFIPSLDGYVISEMDLMKLINNQPEAA